MLRRLVRSYCLSGALLGCLTLACGGSKATDEGSGDGDGESESGTGDGETGGTDSDPACDLYLECVMKVDPEAAADVEAKYGPGGTCWSEDPHDECVDDCDDAVLEILEDFPNELACGGDPLCGNTCCAKDSACDEYSECCGGLECHLTGATSCECADLPERCNTCMSDCLANMVPPEICTESCAVWCSPDIENDPC